MHPRETRRLRARQADALAHPDAPSHNPRRSQLRRRERPATLRAVLREGAYTTAIRCLLLGAFLAGLVAVGYIDPTVADDRAQRPGHGVPSIAPEDLPAACADPDRRITCTTILPALPPKADQ